MDAKPLSNKRRAEIAEYAKAPYTEISADETAKLLHMLADVYMAEQYWRNVVKNIADALLIAELER